MAPFRTIGKLTGEQNFSDGLTVDLLTALSSNAKFRVIRSDAGSDSKTRSNVKAASYRFEGNVRQVGDTIRVSAQLVDPQSGFHFWGGRYDRKMDDVLELQNEVAGKIVATLSDRLAEAESERAGDDTTVISGVSGVLYQGLSNLGRIAERAAFLPQDLLDWMSGSGGQGQSVEVYDKRSSLYSKRQSTQEWI